MLVNNDEADPLSRRQLKSLLIQPPKGAELMEWYEVLGLMVCWDLIRGAGQAWFTKWLINRDLKKKGENE